MWAVAWRVVGIVTTFAANILAARLLGPAEFGSYLLVVTIVVLGALVGMAGLNEAGLRFIASSLAHNDRKLAQAYLRRTFATVALVASLAAIATAAGVLLFNLNTAWFHQPVLLATLAAAGVFVLAWQQIAAESLRGYGRLQSASLFSGGQTGGPVSNLLLLAGLSAVALTATRLDATVALALTVGSVAVTVPWSLRKAWQASRTGDSPDASPVESLAPAHRQELLAVGGVLLLNQVLAFGSQQLDIWLGGAFLEPDALGLYGAAKRSLLLAAMPIQMAMMVVMASVPRLHAQGRTQELERTVRRAANYAAVPALAAIALLALFPETMLHLAFGGSYAGAASTVLVLTLGYLVLVISGNPPYVLTMTGRHRTVAMVNLAAAVVLLVVGSLGAHWYGAPGLAAGSAASCALQNGLLWWFARRHVGVFTHVSLPRRTATAKTSPSRITLDPDLNSATAPEA
ncbi:Polysaccharide biosynthesis protein [Lacipirellula limnantheis]|uniref:Polysaccharide biosynthesis protein n=1 Tax=Lacipirellula limnantheis TaxID=2528024 RepID=A0A517TYJ7_9BACT|nr:Polysaccharide biosynthesis protein [Lacipirellula limnantheis]